jgi:alpha-galactosidase
MGIVERSATPSQLLPTGIQAHPTRPSWALVTEQSCYILGVTEENLVLHQFWGSRLASLDDLPAPCLPIERGSQDPPLTMTTEEYPAFGGLRYGELAFKATFSDGTRDLDLRFTEAHLGEHEGLPELQVILRDTIYPLRVTLSYRVDIANDLIIRSASYTNHGTEGITLERAFSAAWHLPRSFEQRRLTTLAGQWLGETRVQQRTLVAGTELIESRRGTPGASAYPWFAIDTADTPGTNPYGEVYFGTIAWSGNWILRATTNIMGETAITGGLHEADFAWQLKGGATFTTPDFVAGFAIDGLNGARRRLHRHIRNHILPRPQRDEPRPVLYNSWEATLFDVTEEGQIRLAELAAKLGVELFVVDDGWFPGRTRDLAGLGDWRVDPVKFPRGLLPLVRRVQELGMQFGLWVEPEMVNPDSDLYRSHPDWVYHFPNRPRHESRHQLVLNMARSDVQEYLLEALDQLVRENEINFLKWDMNRPISEPGWPEYQIQGGEARELWVRHVEGIYTILDGLRARHPHLSIESCSSGGGRADLAILRRTDQIWASDNTHPDARLLIQEGTALVLPGRVMGAWVTDAPKERQRNEIPLSFRFHVSMMGMLGIGGHLQRWSEEDMDEAVRWIAVYKSIRPLVQDGDQYWLLQPSKYEGTQAAAEFVSADAREAAIFVFRRANVFHEAQPNLRLQALRPDTRYHVQLLGVEDATPITRSGAALMGRGLELPVRRGSYVSHIIHIQALD